MRGSRLPASIAIAAAVAAVLTLAAAARPLLTQEGILPPGTELNDDQLDVPNELFYAELAGRERSHLSKLGDMLFAAPGIFGGMARQASLSCASCHQQGHNNPQLFIPGLSSRPGTVATANTMFSPHSGGRSEPVTPPSLRGAAHLAPYGHDGRFATLRDFIRNAVVNEFAGAEPSPQIVDALEEYVKDIAFLPNRQLGEGGKLGATASDAARRGETIFNRPFRHDDAMSCATCHQPGGLFVDHKLHDVGTGGAFKTPTLLNANFAAPYFHDGRFETYDHVIQHFERQFDLGYSQAEREDLAAYLRAVGDADEPVVRTSVQIALDEIAVFDSVFETAIASRNGEIVDHAVETVGHEWRELGDKFPSRRDPTATAGLKSRLKARDAVRVMVLTLRRVAMAAQAGRYDEAALVLTQYRRAVPGAAATLKAAERFSLFNPRVRDKHFKALDQLSKLAESAGLPKR
jgi:cytochrome c peroxidase